LTFAPGFAFHREQLAETERLQLVAGCVEEVMGRRLRIKLADANDGPGENSQGKASPKSSTPTRRGAAKPKDPAVQRAVEMFGGRVMDDES